MCLLGVEVKNSILAYVCRAEIDQQHQQIENLQEQSR